VNKVNVDANPDLPEVLTQGLGQHGIELLGCIPFSELLANPSLELIVTHLSGKLLAGEAKASAIIGRVAIGAMQADHAVPFLRDRTLLITPGDRDDMLEVALEAHRAGAGRKQPLLTGIVLTGGFRPPPPTLERLRSAGLFTYLVETDTYRTAQDVQDILVKTHPTDVEKIATIIELVGRSIDPGALLARL
jgi:phosphate acetyltransferase